jgi:hypothetical protein
MKQVSLKKYVSYSSKNLNLTIHYNFLNSKSLEPKYITFIMLWRLHLMPDTKELVISPHTLPSPLALTYSTHKAKSNYSVSLIIIIIRRPGPACVRTSTHTHILSLSLKMLLKGENFLQRICKISFIFF